MAALGTDALVSMVGFLRIEDRHSRLVALGCTPDQIKQVLSSPNLYRGKVIDLRKLPVAELSWIGPGTLNGAREILLSDSESHPLLRMLPVRDWHAVIHLFPKSADDRTPSASVYRLASIEQMTIILEFFELALPAQKIVSWRSCLAELVMRTRMNGAKIVIRRCDLPGEDHTSKVVENAFRILIEECTRIPDVMFAEYMMGRTGDRDPVTGNAFGFHFPNAPDGWSYTNFDSDTDPSRKFKPEWRDQLAQDAPGSTWFVS
jgi:hypothetical protein